MDLAPRAKLKFVQFFYPEELSGVVVATCPAKLKSEDGSLKAEVQKLLILLDSKP